MHREYCIHVDSASNNNNRAIIGAVVGSLCVVIIIITMIINIIVGIHCFRNRKIHNTGMYTMHINKNCVAIINIRTQEHLQNYAVPQPI